MKKAVLICALIACLLLPSVVLVTYAHSGRTDSSGGHKNHSTGKYHYHHGYSAHDHYDVDGDWDIDCPYDFDDVTKYTTGGKTIENNRLFLNRLLNTLEALAFAIVIGFTSIFCISVAMSDLFGIEFSGKIIFYFILLISTISFIWRMISIT